jgi:hypothetical protein
MGQVGGAHITGGFGAGGKKKTQGGVSTALN